MNNNKEEESVSRRKNVLPATQCVVAAKDILYMRRRRIILLLHHTTHVVIFHGIYVLARWRKAKPLRSGALYEFPAVGLCPIIYRLFGIIQAISTKYCYSGGRIVMCGTVVSIWWMKSMNWNCCRCHLLFQPQLLNDPNGDQEEGFETSCWSFIHCALIGQLLISYTAIVQRGFPVIYYRRE